MCNKVKVTGKSEREIGKIGKFIKYQALESKNVPTHVFAEIPEDFSYWSEMAKCNNKKEGVNSRNSTRSFFWLISYARFFKWRKQRKYIAQ